ncbi:zinc ribbon domain-containing protein [Dictyobacter kobayashii]|uniref:Uncharacterized protein n=1 Tax=Dictyobacter kobayashii TaxID=2014872 RepID=A0A402AVH4_9CHLR|nr:zinc ribbon domain-containing protein [Dictyobacter kobayashii]GCE23112.1 hypothetical protein KDK_69120 [Dictyobacter kobayashii]
MSHTTQAIIILISTTILVAAMIIIAETYGVKKPHTARRRENCAPHKNYLNTHKPKLDVITATQLAISNLYPAQTTATFSMRKTQLTSTLAMSEENIPTQITHSHCHACKQRVNNEDLFCGYCGIILDKNET